MTPKPGTPTKTPAKKPPRRPAEKRTIYQLRIELQGIAPAIHRTVLVPGTLSLPKLHHVIQAAMGWDEAHLHDFSIGGQRYGEPDPDFPEVDVLDERRHTVGEVLGQATQRFTYTYDFGDSWEHAVKVEKRLPAVEGRNTWPMCIGGQNACPPEDVGGPLGYMDFMEAMASPSHPEHGDMFGWWGGPFDPCGFSLNEANKAIHRLRTITK